jgi:hypothetical protein
MNVSPISDAELMEAIKPRKANKARTHAKPKGWATKSDRLLFSAAAARPLLMTHPDFAYEVIFRAERALGLTAA